MYQDKLTEVLPPSSFPSRLPAFEPPHTTSMPVASSQPVPVSKQQLMMGSRHRPQRTSTGNQGAPSSSAPASGTPATDEPYVLTFGKHVCKTIHQVPLYYAAWLKSDCIAYSVNQRMREAIDSYLAGDAPSSQPTFSQWSRSSQPMPNPTELAAGSQRIRQTQPAIRAHLDFSITRSRIPDRPPPDFSRNRLRYSPYQPHNHHLRSP